MRARERIIRERFADQKCAYCGSPYPADGVLILARRSQAWMVMASCANCEQRGVFVVSFPTQPPEPLEQLDHSRELAQALSSDTPIAIDISSLTPTTAQTLSSKHNSETPYAPPPKDIQAPISTDDVKAMHEFLTSFDGDFRNLFEKRK